jgi:hypothetical protein
MSAKKVNWPTKTSVGQVSYMVAVPYVMSWLASVAFTGASAGIDAKWGGRFASTLWAVFVLQILLFLLMSLRGLFEVFNNVFKMVSVQMLLLFHAITPNLLITSLWVARVVISSVVESAAHPFAGKDYTLLTLAMVFSNIFSGYSLAMVLVNSSFFLDSNGFMNSGDGLLVNKV